MDISSLNAVVIDLETTGLLKRTDRIIEIGALRIREGRIADTCSILVDPGFPLTQEIVEITGITDEMLAGRERFEQIADTLLDFLGDDVLVGHSITGDYAFLKKAFVDCRPKGFVFEKKGIDTLKLARALLEPDEKKRLADCCRHYGYVFHAHRAPDDAAATWFLLQKLYEEFGSLKPELFEPQQLCFAVKRDTPVMEKQKEKLRKAAKEMGIQIDENRMSALTKSQASRILDKLRASDRELFMNLLAPRKCSETT